MSQEKDVIEFLSKGLKPKEINHEMLKKYKNLNNMPIIYKTLKKLGIDPKNVGKSLKGKKLEIKKSETPKPKTQKKVVATAKK